MIRYLLRNWRFYLLTIAPLILLPITFIDDGSGSKKFQCAYVILLMGIFWMFEAMPLAITALLPVALFPLFGIQSTSEVVPNYMRETGMMFFGGITFALAIQYSNLHKRIALRMMILIGSSPWRLLLGIMVSTMTLSSWIVGNTAVAAMMIPIATGLIDSLDEEDDESRAHKNNLRILYMLAVGYSANIGGTAVIIGSIPNLLFKDLIAEQNVSQGGKYNDINFATWIAYNMPIAWINLIICWIYLGILHLERPRFLKNIFCSNALKCKNIPVNEQSNSSMNLKLEERSGEFKMTSETEQMQKILRRKLKELGPMSFHEIAISIFFAIAVILWFARDPQIFRGWMSFFPTKGIVIGDSTVAIFIVILMFVIPKDIKYFKGDFSGTPETLMSWDFIHKNYPWNVILLVGGGFAISSGAEKSGLSEWFGERLNGLEDLPHSIILLLVMIIVSVFTEVMSNAATISLVTPILIALSKKLNMHPLYMTLPGAIACQYAFILPTSNPPNAIVFTAGQMRILDMVKPGIFLNFACLTVLYLMNLSWGQYVIFKYNDYEYPCTQNCTML